ncbi:uncharacterized protein A4U43_C02F10840 [Asparagus officinalis]|uniref:PHD finger protein ALFIN-LIKE n=1 Tax=Asparagus officinalis TaxID=4686 RepID=A0A5P1FM99_ASPOF|nr:uncharacterized protein A4U43_C02F10840 [Asparagus officinalis]
MEARGVDFRPCTLEDIFRDYKGRWTALVKALTIEEANLCLYGYPDERWELSLPSEELPTDLTEPCLGINFARDGMDPDEWISLVSVHSDSWLLAVAFYNAACCGFNRERSVQYMIPADMDSNFSYFCNGEPPNEWKTNFEFALST